MGSHQCCCGPGAPGTCCNSGCECWADAYTASVPKVQRGFQIRCDCCGGCFDGGCVKPGSVVNGVGTPVDPAVDFCCEVFEWEVAGGSIKIYRTGQLACKNFFERDCTDPWTEPTKTLEETGAGCNTYETDNGLVDTVPTYPCPDVPYEDEVSVSIYREIYGGRCEDCNEEQPTFPWTPRTPEEVRWQGTIPVRVFMGCCGDAGTAKAGCEACPDESLPGSGVPHVLIITPLAGVEYQWGGGTAFFAPPVMTFYRRLSCTSTPAGEWILADAGDADVCDDNSGTNCGTCEGEASFLCDCDAELPAGCQSTGECPGCDDKDADDVNRTLTLEAVE